MLSKKGYFELKKVVLAMDEEYSELARQEEEAYRLWEKERSDVLELYKKVKDIAKVTNPYDALSND